MNDVYIKQLIKDSKIGQGINITPIYNLITEAMQEQRRIDLAKVINYIENSGSHPAWIKQEIDRFTELLEGIHE